MKAKEAPKTALKPVRNVTINPPNMQRAEFQIVGTAPLVVHRFSQKVLNGMREKAERGSTAKKGKARECLDPEDVYQNGKYVSDKGWEGFNASGIRNALISACRLVGFKMTLAKLSISVIADGWDKDEPVPLVRIYGKPKRLDTHALTSTGVAYVCIRPCYNEWSAKVKIKYDADQFTLQDVSNLLARVGEQVGICEGRPDSKKSAGMGWGTFELKSK